MAKTSNYPLAAHLGNIRWLRCLFKDQKVAVGIPPRTKLSGVSKLKKYLHLGNSSQCNLKHLMYFLCPQKQFIS